MKVLVKSKLKLAGLPTATLTDLRYTVNGFRAHNAADRLVHWDFFLAREGNRDGVLSWKEHHGMKEVWADYYVMLWKQSGWNVDAAFDQSTGMISAPIHIPFKGNAKLMRLVQMAFRKNRRSTDANSLHFLDVQSLSELEGKLDITDSNTVAGKVYNAEFQAILIGPLVALQSATVMIPQCRAVGQGCVVCQEQSR